MGVTAMHVLYRTSGQHRYRALYSTIYASVCLCAEQSTRRVCVTVVMGGAMWRSTGQFRLSKSCLLVHSACHHACMQAHQMHHLPALAPY